MVKRVEEGSRMLYECLREEEENLMAWENVFEMSGGGLGGEKGNWMVLKGVTEGRRGWDEKKRIERWRKRIWCCENVIEMSGGGLGWKKGNWMLLKSVTERRGGLRWEEGGLDVIKSFVKEEGRFNGMKMCFEREERELDAIKGCYRTEKRVRMRGRG